MGDKFVSAKEVKKKFNYIFREYGVSPYTKQKILEALDKASAADVEPVVHAKLIQIRKESVWSETLITERCSHCGRWYTRQDNQPQINYCCVCGAKMDLEGEHCG